MYVVDSVRCVSVIISMCSLCSFMNWVSCSGFVTCLMFCTFHWPILSRCACGSLRAWILFGVFRCMSSGWMSVGLVVMNRCARFWCIGACLYRDCEMVGFDFVSSVAVIFFRESLCGFKALDRGVLREVGC